MKKMKKFTYPKVVVISLNAAESVMRNTLYTGESSRKLDLVVEHRYTGQDYAIYDPDARNNY